MHAIKVLLTDDVTITLVWRKVILYSVQVKLNDNVLMVKMISLKFTIKQKCPALNSWCCNNLLHKVSVVKRSQQYIVVFELTCKAHEKGSFIDRTIYPDYQMSFKIHLRRLLEGVTNFMRVDIIFENFQNTFTKANIFVQSHGHL